MTTIKIIFRPVPQNDDEGTLYYRLIHKRKVRQINTGSRLYSSEWDSENSTVILGADSSRNRYLVTVRSDLEENLRRLQQIVGILEKLGGEYDTDEIVRRFNSPGTVSGFVSFAREVIAEYRSVGKLSAAGHCEAALRSFIRFNGETDVSLEEIDSRLMSSYEHHMKSNGLCRNTTSYYMRKLRTVYNLAVDRELTEQRNPFRDVYTGVDRTVKRAVSLDIVKTLKNMDLTLEPLSALARDIFLFSFYTRGMSTIDIAYLTRKNLNGGVLSYYRRKTSQKLHIRWEQPMQEIVEHHTIPDSPYLLPLIKPNGKDPRRQYLSAAHLINLKLRELGRRLGLAEPLTMYVARHTWASIARDNDIPLSVISDGMGHTSEATTRIYLASLDSDLLDKANHRLLNLLNQ